MLFVTRFLGKILAVLCMKNWETLTCKAEASVISISVPTDNSKPLVAPALFLRWALLTGTLGRGCEGDNPGSETN